MAGQSYTRAGLMFLTKRAMNGLSPVHFTGDTTSLSTTINTVSSVAGLAVGQLVVGAGIPAGATIASIGTNTITLSAAATASATMVSFYAFGDVSQTLQLSVRLLTGTIPQTPQTAWTDLTEATFNGYAAQTVPLTSPLVYAPKTGWVGFSPPSMSFIPSDYTTPNNITGLAWTYTAPGMTPTVTLIATEVLDSPITLAVAGDIIEVIPVLSLQDDATAGQASPIL